MSIRCARRKEENRKAKPFGSFLRAQLANLLKGEAFQLEVLRGNRLKAEFHGARRSRHRAGGARNCLKGEASQSFLPYAGGR